MTPDPRLWHDGSRKQKTPRNPNGTNAWNQCFGIESLWLCLTQKPVYGWQKQGKTQLSLVDISILKVSTFEQKIESVDSSDHLTSFRFQSSTFLTIDTNALSEAGSCSDSRSGLKMQFLRLDSWPMFFSVTWHMYILKTGKKH